MVPLPLGIQGKIGARKIRKIRVFGLHFHWNYLRAFFRAIPGTKQPRGLARGERESSICVIPLIRATF